MVGDHVREERIRAGGEVGRVGQGENVLDLARGEAFNLAKVGIVKSLPKLIEEVRSACVVVGEAPPQALDRTRPG